MTVTEFVKIKMEEQGGLARELNKTDQAAWEMVSREVKKQRWGRVKEKKAEMQWD